MVDKKIDNQMDYVEKPQDFDDRNFRTELFFAPLLVILPIIVGFFLIYDWYTRDLVLNELDLTAELMLGIIIFVGNILFDIPFIKSLNVFSHKK